MEEQIQLNHKIYYLNWHQFDQDITTIAIFDDNETLIYDTVLSNILRIEKNNETLEKLYSPSNQTIVDNTYGWIWESDYTRGMAKAIMKTVCDDVDGSCVSCDAITCEATMQIGDAQINCKKIKSARTCQVDVSYAVVTGFKSISVGADGFTLSVNGYIGSSDRGNPSKTSTCDLKCCDGSYQYNIADCPNECGTPNSCKTKECDDGSYVCPDESCPPPPTGAEGGN